MGADLAYSSTRLAFLADSLVQTTNDLKNDNHLKRYDTSEVAHHRVVNAIDDFVGDWDDKRRKLTGRVENLASMVSTAHEEFTSADRELAEKLLEAMEDQ